MSVLLKTRSRAITFGLAILLALGLTLHMIAAPVAPVADGAGYTTRAFALYGYLHSGQWEAFGHLLLRPHQSVCSPHQLLFFALPLALANVDSYYALQTFSTYLILAWAVGALAKIMERPAWSPALFLLCAVNHVALMDFYAFYLDESFLALALCAIVWQLMTWRESAGRFAVCAGASLGVLFFVKPANAVILLVLFATAEFFSLAIGFCSANASTQKGLPLKRWGWTLLGFAPFLGLALACGAVQSILLLIDQNEVHGPATPLGCTGLVRLFYFPLCLASLYHVLVLAGLFIVALLGSRWLPSPQRTNGPATFPWKLLLPWLGAFAIFGLFFSFWMIDKPMRALLPLLPFVWLVAFRLGEKVRLNAAMMSSLALLYTVFILAQKAFGFLPPHELSMEENYRLSVSSWTEVPAGWHTSRTLNQVIVDLVSRNLPPRAVIGINAIELRNSLAWRLQNQDFLYGRPPRYQVRNLFNYRGAYFDRSLVGVDTLVLITFYPTQSNRISWMEASEVVDYAVEKWCQPGGPGRYRELPRVNGQTLGYEFRFDPPLTADQVVTANTSTFDSMVRIDSDGVEPIEGHRYSTTEAAALFAAWRDLRFSRDQPTAQK